MAVAFGGREGGDVALASLASIGSPPPASPSCHRRRSQLALGAAGDLDAGTDVALEPGLTEDRAGGASQGGHADRSAADGERGEGGPGARLGG
jgi:hypothetical protein